MWTKTLSAAPWAGPHFIPLGLNLGNSGGSQGGGQELVIHFDPTDDNVIIEESGDLGAGASWVQSRVSSVEPQPDGTAVAHIGITGQTKFYRLKKL